MWTTASVVVICLALCWIIKAALDRDERLKQMDADSEIVKGETARRHFEEQRLTQAEFTRSQQAEALKKAVEGLTGYKIDSPDDPRVATLSNTIDRLTEKMAE